MGKRSTKRYLYRPHEELYDLGKDPAEAINLAGNSDYDDVLKELRAKLGAMRAETDDYWLINDNYRPNRETFPRE
jgi:N-sulfoglucosamine sulfohydrolase